MSLYNAFLFLIILRFFSVNLENVLHGQNTEDDALFLTPYIEARRIVEAQKLAEVKPLMKNVGSFAGFLTVNKTTNANIYFWLFKSQQGNWKRRPLVVWLHGGPGHSSLIGLFGEVGPFFVSELNKKRKHKQNRKNTIDIISVKCLLNASATSSGMETRVKPEDCAEPEVQVSPDIRVKPRMPVQPEMRMKVEVHSKPEARIGPELVKKERQLREIELRRRKFAWNWKYNLLFIDNPVGAGFSFVDTESGYPRDLAAITRDLYEILVQIYELFPFLRSNKFIMAGDSYGMRFALAVSEKILKSHQVFVPDGSINRGTIPVPAGIVGLSGWVDSTFNTRHASHFYNFGQLDRKQYRYFESLEETMRADIMSGNYLEALGIFSQDMKGLFNVTGFKKMTDIIHDKKGATLAEPILRFVNQTDVRTALHVGNRELKSGEAVKSRMADDFMRSTRASLENLLTSEIFPIMFLNGQLDPLAAYASQSEMFTTMDWPRAEEYQHAKRCQFKVGGRVVAYLKTAGTLTEVLVRNAGHMVAYYQPKRVYALLDRFVTNVTTLHCGG